MTSQGLNILQRYLVIYVVPASLSLRLQHVLLRRRAGRQHGVLQARLAGLRRVQAEETCEYLSRAAGSMMAALVIAQNRHPASQYSLSYSVVACADLSEVVGLLRGEELLQLAGHREHLLHLQSTETERQIDG